MQLSFENGTLFYKLYAALLSFVNQKLQVIPNQFADSKAYTALPPQTRAPVRNALYKNRHLIDQFITENPVHLPADELAIVASWKHAIVGQFYVFRYLSKYTIFLSTSSPCKAYGVLALADPLEEMIGPYLPRLIQTVLLPFKDMIIYDGLLSAHNITFGGGVKRSLNDEYRHAKDACGIITTLPDGWPEAPAQNTAEKKSMKKPKNVKRLSGGRSTETKTMLNAIVGLTDAFCKDFLNDEYAEACRTLTGVLARKRPSPLLQGKPESWASGILRTIGMVNFLDDPSQTPHLKLSVIDQAFGVSQSTGQSKSSVIRKMLKIFQCDPKWTLPSRLEDNPLVWMMEVNGFLMDIRQAPREVQEIAYEKGLIPYIPEDQTETNEEKD
jgi:hypothetical protein